MRTSELQGKALDYAVALIEGELQRSHNPVLLFEQERVGGRLHYSTDWAQGGPIIEREGIELILINGTWESELSRPVKLLGRNVRGYCHYAGPTPLIAAMRCYVASKLGDTVDIPEDLTS